MQLSFDDMDRRLPTDRLLFLIYVEPQSARRAAALATERRKEHGLRGTPLAAERLHITLHHLGDYPNLPEETVETAKQAAESVIASPFEVAFDHTMSFKSTRKRPFVMLGSDGHYDLRRFQVNLGRAMLKLGLEPDARSKFTPHVTLLYDEAEVARQSNAPIAWTVREFALVHSLLGRTEHHVLGRWPLYNGHIAAPTGLQ